MKPSPEKKSATRPWDSQENPWATDIFRIKHRAGFRPRFVEIASVDRKREEGWEVANASDYRIEPKDGGTTVIRRGMILMEMSEEMANKREAYIKRKTELQTRSAKEFGKGSIKKISKELGEDISLSDD